MFHFATLQPDVVQDTEIGHAFFSQADREKQIRDFYAEDQDIPLNLNHDGCDVMGRVVVPMARCGRVLDLLQGRDGALLVKMQLYTRHKAYAEIANDLMDRRNKWGVSVFIDATPREKRLVHVALTKTPLLAAYNTFIHLSAWDEAVLDREIAHRFYAEGDGRCFAVAAYKTKLRGMLASLAEAPTAPEPPEPRMVGAGEI